MKHSLCTRRTGLLILAWPKPKLNQSALSLNPPPPRRYLLAMRSISALLVLLISSAITFAQSNAAPDGSSLRHLLYVAVPGIRDYPQYGGNGILVFDIDHNHKFVRRINVPAMGTVAKPQAAKGICASAVT